jgi:hypothetical protein
MAKLDVVVAEDAGARGLPPQIGRDERLDDGSFEFVLEVEDVEGKTKVRRDAPRIPDVVERAAPSLPQGLGFGIPVRARSCMERPTISCPSRLSSTAAAEESTPPLMATAIIV